jgi:hypothetical protein
VEYRPRARRLSFMRACVVALAACAAAPAPASVANAKPPPAVCIPRAVVASLGSEPGFALPDGDMVLLCLNADRSGFCMRVDPATGDVVARRAWRTPPAPDEIPAAATPYTPSFPIADNSAYAAILDPSHRYAFVLGATGTREDVGDTYEVATGKRIHRTPVVTLNPKDSPPPPIEPTRLVWRADAIVIGNPDGYSLLLDPARGTEIFLEPGYVMLGDHLLVGHDWITGEAFVEDLAGPVREIARKRFGARHTDGSIVDTAIAATADRAIVTGFTPLVTLGIDRNGTISEPRPLPICPPD